MLSFNINWNQKISMIDLLIRFRSLIHFLWFIVRLFGYIDLQNCTCARTGRAGGTSMSTAVPQSASPDPAQ